MVIWSMAQYGLIIISIENIIYFADLYVLKNNDAFCPGFFNE